MFQALCGSRIWRVDPIWYMREALKAAFSADMMPISEMGMMTSMNRANAPTSDNSFL
jgi:hypothetical protein